MPSCPVLGCKSGEADICSWHRVPSDGERRRVWLHNLNRPDWTPTPNSRICGRHFADGHPTPENPFPVVDMGGGPVIAKIGRDTETSRRAVVAAREVRVNTVVEEVVRLCLSNDAEGEAWLAKKFAEWATQKRSLRRLFRKKKTFSEDDQAPSNRQPTALVDTSALAYIMPLSSRSRLQRLGEVCSELEKRKLFDEIPSTEKRTFEPRFSRPVSHWICSLAMRSRPGSQFQFLTGLSKGAFAIIAKNVKNRFGTTRPIIYRAPGHRRHEEDLFYRFVGRSIDWPDDSLFYFLSKLRHAFGVDLLTNIFGADHQSTSDCPKIFAPILADLLKPLIFWPTIAQDMPPGFFLTGKLDDRFLAEGEIEMAGVLDVVTCETNRVPDDDDDNRTWKASFLVVYNFYGALIYRSRLFWWHSAGGVRQWIFRKILRLVYRNDLRKLLKNGKLRRVLLATKKYTPVGCRWLWHVGDDDDEDRRFKYFLIENFEGRLKKSFRLFRSPQRNLYACSHLDELVTVCCALVNLMPPVDWIGRENDNRFPNSADSF